MNVFSKLTAKGRIATVLALGFATLFSGCKEEDPPAVSVDRPIVRTSMAEQTQPLRVISNTDWTATIDYSETAGQTGWISMPRTTGKGTMDLTLYIEKCNMQLMDGRQATITFKTNSSPVSIATVKVRQGHDEGILELQPDQIEVGAGATSVFFLIQSNTQWEIIESSSWAKAVTISGEGNQLIEINVDEYPNHGYDREAEFVVMTTNLAPDNISRVFTLTQRDQEDPTLILGQETLYFEAEPAGGINVPIITNTSEVPFVTPNASWCHAVYNASNRTIDVTVDNNPTINQRECTITVMAFVDNAPVTKQIRVIQAGLQDPKIIVTNPNVTIDANPVAPATTIDFAVGFFTEPDALESLVTLIADKPAWISSAAINGNAVEIKALPNPSKEMRQATLTLKLVSAGKTVTAAITVTQNGVGDMNLTATPASLNAVQVGETLTFTILSDIPNVTVNVTSGRNWATVGAPAAQMSTGGTIYEVSVVVDANADADSRDAVLTVTGVMGSQTQMLTVNVNQAGTGSPQASLVRNSITVPKIGDDYQVGISNTGGITGWSYSASANWISGIAFNPADGTIDFTVADNTVSAANRTAVISIIAVKGGRSQQLDLEVIQLGTGSAELIISEQDIVLPAAATTYTVFIEELNGTTWSVLGYNPQDMFASAPTANADGLEISVTANTTTKPRNATINLIATNGDSTVPYTITIRQEGLSAPDIVPVTSIVYVGQAATTVGAETLVALLNWDSSVTLATTTVSNPAMFGATTGTDTSGAIANLKIAVTENTGTEQRTGKVTVIATRGGQNQLIEITVVQAGTGTPDLTIGSPSFMFGPDAQTGVNLFFANENGATVTINSKPSWISENTALTDGVWVFDVAENGTNKDRSGEIVLKAELGGKTVFYNVPVFQYGLESLGASLTVSSIQVDYEAADPVTDIINLLNVPANAVVNVYSSQTWLTLDGTNTSLTPLAAPYEITPSVEANPRYFERTGTIAFEITRGTESQVLIVSVMQHGQPVPDALTIIAVPGALNFEATDTAMNITIVNYDAALAYTVIPNATWLTTTHTNGVIEVTPAINNGTARTATVTISAQDTSTGAIATSVITITQAGATDVTLILDHASVDFNAQDDNSVSAIVNVVNPDAAFTYEVTEGGTGWFDATVTGTQITVTPQTANTGAARTGTIIVNAKSGGATVATKVISVTQSAYGSPTLTLNQESLEFAASDGVGNAMTVNASSSGGVTYGISVSASWIAASIDPTGVATISPTAANTAARREGTATVSATGINGEMVTKTILVAQEAAAATTLTLTPVPGALNFEAADTAPMNVTIVDYDASFTYTVGSSAGWVTVPPTAPDANGVIAVTPTANTGAARTATITVAVKNLAGAIVEKTIAVTQAGANDVTLTLDHASVDFNAADTGAATVNIVNPDAGLTYTTVQGGGAWFTVGAIAADGSFTVTPTGANTGAARTGTIVVRAANGSTVVATKVITVTQSAFNAPVLTLTLGQASANFAADEDNTVSIDFTAYATAGATFSVVASATWIVPTIDATTGIGSVSPREANTGAKREGTITVTAKNVDGQVATKTIPVTQEGVVPVTIIASAYQVSFPAAAAIGDFREITLIGFDPATHTFSSSVISGSGTWFAVTPPTSPMKIEVNGPWTGATERKATIQVTITKTVGGGLVSTFPITIVQDGVEVPNITYAPETFYNVPVEGTAPGVPLKVTFVNPGAVPLNVVSTTSNGFISNAVFSGDILEITVAQNPNYGTRTGQVVVSAADGGTVVKTYTVTVQQDGTGAIAPFVYAQFDDGGTVYLEKNPPTDSPYSVGMTLQSGVTISSVTVSGTPAWLTGATKTGAGFEFTYDSSVFNETSTVSGLVQVNLAYTNGINPPVSFTMYYNVIYRGELPEIGATWDTVLPATGNVANISAITTTATVTVDDSTLTSPLTLADLTVAYTDIIYTGSASGWIDTSGFAFDSANGNVTLNAIDENDTAVARSAVVKITLSATDYKDQVMEFVVNQAGLLPMPLSYQASVVADYNQTPMTVLVSGSFAPTTFATVGPIDVGGATWLTCSQVVPIVNENLSFTFDPNNTGAPRTTVVSFTLSDLDGYQTKTCSIYVVQMPEPPVDPLLTINPLPTLAYAAGSTANVTYIDNGLVQFGTATTVTLYKKDDATISDVDPVTSTQATVTAAALNATGSDRDCTFLLKAVNGTTTEFYEVTVPQASLTQAELIASVTMAKASSIPSGANNNINSVSHGTPRTNVNVTSGYPNTTDIQDNAFISIASSLSISYGTISTSNPDNALNNDATRTGNRINLRVNWHAIWSPYTGTAVVTVPISVDAISADFIITIVVS